MTGKDIFKMWSPVGVKWVDWIRPVPFIDISDFHKNNKVVDFTIPNIQYISKRQDDTAIILDLPSHDSIEEGLALAKLGYRPIPIYNGTQVQPGAMALVDNHLEHALVWGAYTLQKMKLKNDAPPAFLLDSNRTHQFKMKATAFDNSWDIYEQDLPSAEYLLRNGINKIIVRGDILERDVIKVLFNFQKKGLTIFLSNGYEELKEVTIKAPRRKQK